MSFVLYTLTFVFLTAISFKFLSFFIMKITRLFLLSFIFTAIVAVSAIAREVRVQILVTADIHARIFPYDFVNDRPFNASMAHVYTLVRAARAQPGSNLILLDNGDLIQGSPAGYFAHFVQEADKNLFSRVMNLMRFDAATVGNHDIEAGPEVYNRLLREFRFPWLGANVLNTETGEPFFKPYTIISRQGVRIAVLGLTTPGVPTWLPEKLWKGMQFQELAESAKYWVRHIKEKENPDAIVGLFHSGLGSATPEPGQRMIENAAHHVALTVPGFDVIFMGHDHREWLLNVTNSQGEEVVLIGPGPFGEKVGAAELVFFRNAQNRYELINTKSELISTTRMAPDRVFFEDFDEDVTAIIAYSSEVVGQLKADMSSLDAFFGSAAFVDLVHDLQLRMTQADVSFTAPLSFNEVIKAGPMRVRDFFNLYRFENYLYVMELTGAEILGYLEHSYGLWLNTMETSDCSVLLFRENAQGKPQADAQGRFRLRNPSFNFDSAAGIRYIVDVTKPAGQRITILSLEDGTPFQQNKVYRVAINSYRGSGGGDHLTIGAGIPHESLRQRIVFTSEKDLRSEMMDYFREQKEVTPAPRNNWKIIPEDWVQAARTRDLRMLMP
ncbi:MAG TPA: bifunctional metallophosphatase/5'-nucleotidase [Bacteroidales bacterium]|nr:bifunctional metallophosphatase/5'-nucleotidase [Bacteroidales bacterium]